MTERKRGKRGLMQGERGREENIVLTVMQKHMYENWGTSQPFAAI